VLELRQSELARFELVADRIIAAARDVDIFASLSALDLSEDKVPELARRSEERARGSGRRHERREAGTLNEDDEDPRESVTRRCLGRP
jgi:hypothetical protein